MLKPTQLKVIPMIIMNTKTGEKNKLDISHQAEGHTKPGSSNQVQKSESHLHPSSSSVQLPSRFLQYLAVDDAAAAHSSACAVL